MNNKNLDPREHPYKKNVAASYLKNEIVSERYVDGETTKVTASLLPMHCEPDFRATRASELLFGEIFTIYDLTENWAWGQSQTDGYVGFVPAKSLSEELVAATHEVGVLRTYAFSCPNLKSEILTTLHMTSRVLVTCEQGGYYFTDVGGWVPKSHLKRIGDYERDVVKIARKYLGAPYLWGGRSSFGLDCSGLVQLSLAGIGRSVPRDSDQQERSVGKKLDNGLLDASPGDLLYMPGHVAMMSTLETVIHSNAFHMSVIEEPLGRLLDRLDTQKIRVSTVRRP